MAAGRWQDWFSSAHRPGLPHPRHQGRGQLTQVPQLTREGASLPALTPLGQLSCPLPCGSAPQSYSGQMRAALPCVAAHEGRSQLSHTTPVRGGTCSPAPSGPARGRVEGGSTLQHHYGLRWQCRLLTISLLLTTLETPVLPGAQTILLLGPSQFSSTPYLLTGVPALPRRGRGRGLPDVLCPS